MSSETDRVEAGVLTSKVVQLQAVPMVEEHENYTDRFVVLYAVCEDGSVWQRTQLLVDNRQFHADGPWCMVQPPAVVHVKDEPTNPGDCPFEVGDVIQHHMDIEDQAGPKWQIVGITSERLLVVNFYDHNDASHIERKFWRNYSRVSTAASEVDKQADCPFEVGDVIVSRFGNGAILWTVQKVLQDRINLSEQGSSRTAYVLRSEAYKYRLVKRGE